MTGILKAQDLRTPEELANLLQAVRAPEEERLRIWLAAPDGWAFDFWPNLAGAVAWCGAGRRPIPRTVGEILADADEGRLFANSGELRWRRVRFPRELAWRVVFLGREDWLAEGLQDRSGELRTQQLTPERRRYLLWGAQSPATPGEWIELQIPHRFRWPLDSRPHSASRVLLEVEVWSDPAGEPHFQRFCDLHPSEETD